VAPIGRKAGEAAVDEGEGRVLRSGGGGEEGGGGGATPWPWPWRCGAQWDCCLCLHCCVGTQGVLRRAGGQGGREGEGGKAKERPKKIKMRIKTTSLDVVSRFPAGSRLQMIGAFSGYGLTVMCPFTYRVGLLQVHTFCFFEKNLR
jgi:hypothetical protein